MTARSCLHVAYEPLCCCWILCAKPLPCSTRQSSAVASLVMKGLLARSYTEALEEIVCGDPDPAPRACSQVWRVFGRHCEVQMLMDGILEEVEEVIYPQRYQSVLQMRHVQQVRRAVYPGTLMLQWAMLAVN